ncbi:MAG TPA: alpha/beta fold hydrolase [Aggregatilineales bacterium]|nr:alpha/beta fold hydrolase [Anaerolineales bacterium]HRE46890.1 alpha/beta fold hydrolase [Aggregatilineales bacterium]
MFRKLPVVLILIMGFMAITPKPAEGGVIPRLEAAPCPVAIPDPKGITCGYLIVHEDRANPSSRLIRVAFVVAKATSDSPSADPVFYLHGGPGQGILSYASWWGNSSFRSERDVIIVDQRGAGKSSPSLACPEMDDLPLLTLTEPITPAAAAAIHAQTAEACAVRLNAEGIALHAYTNRTVAADLDDLRRLLGYSQVNLFAYSAGTRLALTLMRDYPATIRAVILDSIYAPPGVDYYSELTTNAAATFETLFAYCAADAACHSAYPDLKATFQRAIQRLAEQPATFMMIEPDQDDSYTATMTREAFVGLIYRLLYDPATIGILPRLIETVSRGDETMLPALLKAPLHEPKYYSMGLNQALHCGEIVPYTAYAPPKEGDPFAGFYHWDVNPEAFKRLCPAFGMIPNPEDNRPVVSDIPTLILSGALDPAAPPVHAEFVAKHLTNAHLITFPTQAHFVWDRGGACPKGIATAFLAAPTQAPSTECLTTMPPIPFITPPQVVRLSGAAEFMAVMTEQGITLKNFSVPIFVGILALVSPLFVAISVIRPQQRVSAAARSLQIGHVLAGGMLILDVLAVISVYRVLTTTATGHYGMLYAGVPLWASIIFLIPIVVAILAVGLLALIMFARRGRVWSAGTRLYYGLIALASFGLILWLAGWGLVPL